MKTAPCPRQLGQGAVLCAERKVSPFHLAADVLHLREREVLQLVPAVLFDLSAGTKRHGLCGRLIGGMKCIFKADAKILVEPGQQDNTLQVVHSGWDTCLLCGSRA